MATVDVTGFVDMCESLARMSGRDFGDVLLPQVGAMLSACIRRTPFRKIGEIAKRASKNGSFIRFADGTELSVFKKSVGVGVQDKPEMFLDISTYSQYAGRWPKGSPTPNTGGGRSWHQMNNPNRHWSDERWGRFLAYESLRKQLVKKNYEDMVAARGLAKQTWVQIADALGVDVKAPGWVRAAKFRDREFREGFATKFVEAGALIIEVVNSNPLMVGKLNGLAILEGALRDREKAFSIDMDKGVFNDLKRRAQRYPGIFTEE